MNYYVLHVKTREEDEYIASFVKRYAELPVKRFFFKRELAEKKCGKPKVESRPLFSGYIFLETAEEDEVDAKLWINACRKVGGFVRFLPEAPRPTRLAGRALELVQSLLCNADRRKGRLKVRLAFCKNSFTIDLGFESVRKV